MHQDERNENFADRTQSGALHFVGLFFLLIVFAIGLAAISAWTKLNAIEDRTNRIEARTLELELELKLVKQHLGVN